MAPPKKLTDNTEMVRPIEVTRKGKVCGIRSWEMTNVNELSVVSKEPFADALANFLLIKNSSSALAFLIGAGCSRCAGLPLTNELTDKVLADDNIDSLSKEMLITVRNEFADGTGSNIEDYLSEIVDMLAITERRAERGVEENTVVVGNSSYTAEQLRNAIIKLKRAIAEAIDRKVSIDMHRRFVTSVHRPLRVGRQGISQPVDYLVLNYDTIVEDSLAIERIPYADGLSGGATAWWDDSAFDADGVSTRVIKLHGSINWYQFPDDPLPRRIGTGIELENQTNIPLLIWPSSTKYQEAQLDPFAQLLHRARIALRPSSGSQRLLVICGYSFGDRHINLEIDRALHESGGNLTIAAFTDRNEPCGLLQEWREDNSVRDQVLVFSNRGFFRGDEEHISKEDLPWWKFENLTRILNGEV